MATTAPDVPDQPAVGAARFSPDEQFARFAIERMPAALTMYDSEGQLVYSNPMARRVLGLDEDEMESRTSNDARWRTIHEDGSAFGPEDYPVNRTLKTGESCHEVAMGILRPDGAYSWVLINSEPLLAPGNTRPHGVVAIFLDVTERINIRAQLYEAQKLDALGKLSGGVAHDFRNILQAVTTSSEMLARSGLSDRAARQVAVIRKAAGRAAALTEQLLAVGQRRSSNPRALDLRDVITSSVQLFEPVLGDRILVKTRVEETLWLIHADAGMIGQVIMNLVLNARDAMPNGGKIQIDARNFTADEAYERRHIGFRRGEYVLLTVSDSGCGIPPEVKEKIFDPYFSTKKSDGEHAGLGLAVVHGIVQQQRGRIWVYSEPGKGTSFKIFFPRYIGSAQPEQREWTADTEELGAGEVILLVDDTDLVLDVLGDILEMHQYAVVRCSTPEEALAAAATRHIDLLLTDTVMRSMNGFELARRLADLKVIYMSGYSDEAIQERNAHRDAPFLEKPIAASDLLRTVRAVLAR